MPKMPTLVIGIAWILGMGNASEVREASGDDSVQGRRPNVVVIYADDLGFGDLHVNAPQTSRIPTPHLDRLAAQGMRFTDAHSSSAVCSPSRYTLLTGRYHWRTRLQSGIVNLWGPPLIDRERLTLGSLAQRQGYATACIGKWHLGWEWPIPESLEPYFQTTGYQGEKDLTATPEHRAAWEQVFSRRIPGGPLAVGFAHYFGTDVPNWPPYCFIEDEQTVGVPSEFADVALFAKNQASQQGPALAGWRLEPILPRLGQESITWIQSQADHDAPFLLYLSLTSPHTPLAVNEAWRGKSGLGTYADLVMETDAVIGQVLDALDKAGIRDETLVIFTSDNGCAPYIGVKDLEAQGHFPSGPYRGYKSDVWEGGHRVPFVMRWPGQIEAGSVCHQLVHQADVLATLADLWHESLAANEGEDSFSLLPLWSNPDQVVRETAVSCSIQGVPGMRWGPWKYIPASGSGGWTAGGDEAVPVQLYQLESDPGETTNLAMRLPERVAALQERLETLIEQGRSTPGPSQPNDVPVRRYPKGAPLP